MIHRERTQSPLSVMFILLSFMGHFLCARHFAKHVMYSMHPHISHSTQNVDINNQSIIWQIFTEHLLVQACLGAGAGT